jgi:cardiolipin synthase
MLFLPNALTIFRILLVPVFALCFVMPGDVWRLFAFATFCLAGISDALDGALARRYHASSDFGRMLDPIADKVLVGVALMLIVADGTIKQFRISDLDLHSLLRLVPALIILAREILVSGLREFLAGAGVSVAVTQIAKLKTAIQMIAIGAMILGPMADRFIYGSLYVAYILLWIAAALTVYTGYVYFRAGLKHVGGPLPSERKNA